MWRVWRWCAPGKLPLSPPVLKNLQLLRAIAALMVVLFHLRGIELKYGQGLALLDAPARYADAGVDLFFVLSGFLISGLLLSGFVMGTLLATRPTGRNAALGFLARRAWRVLPPYWIYTTMVVVLMLLYPGQVNTSYSDQSVLASYLLWPHDQLPVLTVGWTLVHEAYFYLAVSVVIAFVPTRLVTPALLLWAAVIAGCVLTVPPPVHPTLRLLSNPLTLEFIAGALFGLHWRAIPATAGMPILVFGVAAMLSALGFMPDEGPGTLPQTIRVAVFGTASLAILAGAVLLEKKEATASGFRRLLQRLGDSSYSLYLSHIFVISALGRLWGSTGLVQTPFQHAVFLVVSVLACCLCGWLSWVWLERPLLALGQRVLRRRSATQACMR